MKQFDVIIIGAGSIGVPIAMALGEIGGFKVAVIEKNAEVGQGQNNRSLKHGAVFCFWSRVRYE